VKASLAPILLGGMALTMVPIAGAQSASMSLPKTVDAGTAFSIQTAGNGKGSVYIVGPAQALKEDVTLGQTISIAAGSLYNAGRYLVVLTAGSSTDKKLLDVTPAKAIDNLSFFAKPSRLPVARHNGISGTVYTFDAYHNLVTRPTAVTFELTNPAGAVQQRSATTKWGRAWITMDSTEKEGNDKFVAEADGVSSARIIEQVPGDPCSLKMNAKLSGQHLEVTTDPVRDCSGNAVPDGTIVTFTENYNGTQSTVDVPLKRGIARVEMPAHAGATISVASGVVLGNEIHCE